MSPPTSFTRQFKACAIEWAAEHGTHSGVPLRPLILLLPLHLCLAASAAPATQPSLTIIAWSDQHILANGDASHLTPAIFAINAFEPAPAFVLGCGDCTDWPTSAAVNAWTIASNQLNVPSYTVLGNHDEGRDPSNPHPSDRWRIPAILTLGCTLALYLLLFRLSIRKRLLIAIALSIFPAIYLFHRAQVADNGMKDWLLARQPALSYTFNRSGVHFICIFTPYTSPETIGPDALAFIRNDLAKTPVGMPVVLATHYCYESIHNKDALIDALAGSNTILILGGHHHVATVNRYRSIPFVQVPSTRYTPLFTVITISGNRVTARPYNFQSRQYAQTSPALNDSE